MCVIFVADKRRPSDEELEKMEKTNGDGAGVAWQEGDHVKWVKGLTLEEMKPFCANLPMPFVGHFRIASIGGKTPEMTHPHPVERDMRADLSGEIKGSVLFHNGTWHQWKDRGLDGTIKNKVKVPSGRWNDTRVMAWLAHLHGPGVLEFIDEKVILLSPSKIEIFHPDGFYRVNELLVSNRIWENQFMNGGYNDSHNNWDSYYGGGAQPNQICRQHACNKKVMVPSWYCEDHQPPCRWAQCSKPRVGGSEHCAEHQPVCSERQCLQPREPHERFCLKHLIITPPAGGTNGRVLPLTRLQVEAEISDDMIQVDSQPAVMTDPVLQQQRRWACGINPKVIKPHLM